MMKRTIDRWRILAALCWIPGSAWLAAGCAQDATTEAADHLSERALDPGRETWKSRGVGGGGALFSPVMSPHAAEEMFLASDMTGVYHTGNFGRAWTTLPFQRLEGGVQSQLRFTADPKVLYTIKFKIPTDDAADARWLGKSTDGGITWDAPVTSPGVPNAMYSLQVDPHSTRRLLVADRNHLFFSSDGGHAFKQVHESAWEGGLVVAGAFWDDHAIHVGTNDGVLVSRDNGASFAVDPAMAGIPATESIVSFAGSKQAGVTRFFAVTFRNRDDEGNALVNADITGGDLDSYAGLYRWTTGETSWTPTAAGLAASDSLAFVAMSDRNVNVAYVAGGDRAARPLHPAILKTTDGGQTWRHVLLVEHNANVATGWAGYNAGLDWEFAEYALGLAVSPRDADRVAFTDLGLVHVSTNGGASWAQAYVDPEGQNPIGADTPPSRYYRSSGLEQTSGWWLTWGDDKTLFASLTDIRSARSKDGGKSWTRDGANGLSWNTTYHVVSDPQTGVLYAATSGVHDLYQSPYLRDSTVDDVRVATGAVVASADKGATWRVVHDFHLPVVWLALDPRDRRQLYASVVNSQMGGIYHIDLGAPGSAPTLLPAPPRTLGHPFNVYVLNDGSLVATFSGHQSGRTRVFGDRSGVFVLSPGATAWTDRSAPEMHYWTKDIIIDPSDASQATWYVTVFSHDANRFGGLYRTTDRGATWRRISAHFRVDSAAIDPRNPDRMYMTTQGEGLWLTEDLTSHAPSFHQVADYPFQQPTRVFWNPYHRGEVWVVSFGGGMRVKNAE